MVLASSRWSPLSRLTQRRRVFKERSIRAAHSALRRPAVRVPVLPLRASTTDRPSVVSLITVCTLHAVLITTQSLADVAEAALATTIDTLMTAAADTVDAMTMVPVAQDTMIAATEVAAAAMTTVLVVSIAMPLIAATVAGMAVATADAMIVGVVEVATTTGPHPQLLAPTMHLLRVRRTAEDARTRVTTIAHTASSPLTQAEPKRY